MNVDKSTLQYLRDRAIKLRENGKSNNETAQILGVAPIVKINNLTIINSY